jgi:acetyltransferase
MERLIDTARARRFRLMHGLVLRENRRMLAFVRSLGFEVRSDPDDHEVARATLVL